MYEPTSTRKPIYATSHCRHCQEHIKKDKTGIWIVLARYAAHFKPDPLDYCPRSSDNAHEPR